MTSPKNCGMLPSLLLFATPPGRVYSVDLVKTPADAGPLFVTIGVAGVRGADRDPNTAKGIGGGGLEGTILTEPGRIRTFSQHSHLLSSG